MGTPGPVPWTALDKYAERHGLLEDEVLYEDFMAYMAAMDNAYLSHAAEQAEQNRKESANAT